MWHRQERRSKQNNTRVYRRMRLSEETSSRLSRVWHAFWQRVGYATVGIEVRSIPPFAKSAKDGAPGDLLHFLPRTRNVLFHPTGA
jgi:hypothetical protein